MKKIIAALFAVAITMMSVVVTTAFAEKATSVWIDGVELMEGYYMQNGVVSQTKPNSGYYTYLFDGLLQLGEMYYSTELGINDKAVIYAEGDLEIEVANSASITYTSNSTAADAHAAIYVTGNLRIFGDQGCTESLEAKFGGMMTTGLNYPENAYGIYAGGNLEISNFKKVDAYASPINDNGSMTSGIYAGGELKIQGISQYGFYASAGWGKTSCGIQADSIVVEDCRFMMTAASGGDFGQVTNSYGMRAGSDGKGSITFTGDDNYIMIKTGSGSNTKSDKNGTAIAFGSLTVNGGEVEGYVGSYVENGLSLGGQPNSTITINGGWLKGYDRFKGASLVQNGGEVNLSGSVSATNAVVTVNNGKFTASSSTKALEKAPVILSDSIVKTATTLSETPVEVYNASNLSQYKYIEITSDSTPGSRVSVNYGTATFNGKEIVKAAPGTTVTVAADDRTSEGLTFTSWESSDVTFADSTRETTTFNMPDKAVTVEAVYEQSHKHRSCGDIGCYNQYHYTNSYKRFQGSLDFDTSDTENAAYYLYKDITVSSTLTVPSGDWLYLCLNGYTMTADFDGDLFNVKGDLILCDCKGTGKILRASGKTGRVASITYGRFDMYGGTLNGHSHDQMGGCFYNNQGDLTLLGGEISGNTAYHGGAIYNNGGFVSVSGAKVNDNIAQDSYGNGCGGAIYSYKGRLSVSGGEINNNSTGKGEGGGIYVYDGFTNLSGGVISGNTAGGDITYSRGGGIYGHTDWITISGSTIEKNRAVLGGGVYAYNTALDLQDGKITANTAEGTSYAVGGGGVYVAGSSEVSVEGPIHVSGNKGYGNKPNNIDLSETAGLTIERTGEITGNIGVTVKGEPAKGNPIVFMTGATDMSEIELDCITSDQNYQDKKIEGDNVQFFVQQPVYSIAVQESAGGKVTVSHTEVEEEEFVTLIIQADSGYELNTLTVIDADGNSVPVTDGVFAMPACNVTVKATFVRNNIYEITAMADPAAGGVVSGGGMYLIGTKVTLEATAEAGYTFDGWYLGETKVSTLRSFTLEVTGSQTYVAKFAHRHVACAWTACSMEEHEHGTSVISYQALDNSMIGSTISYSNGDAYVLTENINGSVEFNGSGTLYLCLNGYTIKGENGKYALIQKNDGTLVLCDCNGSRNGQGVITHAENTEGGGVRTYGDMIMYGGTVSNNTADFGVDGAGIFASGDMTMHGGAVNDNATYSTTAGVCAKNVTITGGTIANNNNVFGSSTYGLDAPAGVYAADKLKISGGVITGNRSKYGKAGGVYAGTKVTVSGNAKIFNNMGDTWDGYDDPNDIWLLGYQMLGIDGELVTGEDGAKIGILRSGAGNILQFTDTTNVPDEETLKAVFTSNNWGYTVVLVQPKGGQPYGALAKLMEIAVEASPAEGGKVSDGGTYIDGDSVTLEAEPHAGYAFDGWYLGDTKVSEEAEYTIQVTESATYTAKFIIAHSHAICGKKTCGDENHGHSMGLTVYKMIDNSMANGVIDAQNGDAFVLTEDIYGSLEFDVYGEIYLCLNGNKIYGEDGKTAVSVKCSYGGCSLVLCDCSNQKTGVITHEQNKSGSGVYAQNYFTMYGGTISGNTTKESTDAGGVYTQSFEMYDGTICYNRAEGNYDSVGGVAAYSATLHGGEIKNNSTVSGIGGIEARNVTVSGNIKIINNKEEWGNYVADRNLFLESGGQIFFDGELVTGEGGAEIGITHQKMNEKKAFIEFTGTQNVPDENTLKAVFKSDYPDYDVVLVQPENGNSYGALVRMVTVEVSAIPTGGGSVEGGGEYAGNSQVTLKAMPAEGYEFEYWARHNRIVSEEPIYTFTAETDTKYIACFKVGEYEVTAETNPIEGGVVTAEPMNGVKMGDKVTLTVIPNKGYLFSEFIVTDASGNEVPVTDGVFAMPASDVTVSAVFVVCDHTNAEYIVTGETSISQVCTCGYVSGASANLSVSENSVYDGQPKPAVVTGDLTEYELWYTTGDGEKLEGAPVNAGTYTATLAVGGKSVSVTYTIDKAAYAGNTTVDGTLVNRGTSTVVLPELPEDAQFGEIVKPDAVTEASAQNGVLSVTGSDAVQVGTTYTLTIPVTAANYHDFTVVVTLTGTQHEHVWGYTADDEKDIITAACTGSVGVCPVDDRTIVISLTDPVNLTYDGNAKEAEAAYSVPDVLAAQIDYEGDRINVTEAGFTVVMTVETANVSKRYSILPASLEHAVVTGEEKIYTGDALETAVTVELGENTLDEAGYEVAYANNTNVGEATITVSGKGNYTGTVSGSFIIRAADIKDAVITMASDTSLIYTGSEIKPAVTVSLGEKELTAETDYEVSYSDNINVGTAIITVTGKGNYAGTANKTFLITKSGAAIAAKTYLGEAEKDVFTYGETITIAGTVHATGTAPAQARFTLAEPAAQQVALFDAEGTTQISDPVNVDENGAFELNYDTTAKLIQPADTVILTVKFVGDANMSDERTQIAFKLNKKTLKPASAEAEDRTYALGNKTVSVTAVTLDGVVGGDTVSVKGLQLTGTVDSDAVGTYASIILPEIELDGADAAFYTVSGTTAKTNVTISPKAVTAPMITLDQNSFVYDGEEKKPTVTVVKDGENVIPAEEYTVTYANNVNAGTATVTIMDAEGGNYTVSGSVTFAITQANTAMTAQTDKDAYTYGDKIIVTGTAVAPKQEEQTFDLLRLIKPTEQQVALYDAEGNQLTDGVSVSDGAYSITYDTKAKMIDPAEVIILTVGFVGDANMSNQEAQTNVFALTAKTVEPVLDGTVSKAYDAMTTVPQNHSLIIGLKGKLDGDAVSASGSFAYGDAAVGKDKTINVSGIALSGDDAKFYLLTANTASGMVGEIVKAKLTGVKVPKDRELDVYCTDAAAVMAGLPETLSYTIEGGNTVDLAIRWSCENYNNTPSAENTFTWTADDEKLACYEMGSGVAAAGSIMVKNKAADAVTLIGKDMSIAYDGKAFDVSAMFSIDEKAGTASYEIVSGGTGEGMFSGSMLTITKAGTLNIKLSTAANGAYAAAEATAVLTVEKGMPVVTAPIGLIAVYAQTLSQIDLPTDNLGTWDWTDGSTLVGDAGEQKHKAVFTPDDLDLWNTVTVDVTLLVVQSGTDLAGEGLNHANGQYVYGEDIVVTLKANANGNAALQILRNMFVQPEEKQMALYKRVAGQPDEQITQPVSEVNGRYVLMLRTEDKLLAIGDHTITAKYVGDDNAADAETVYTVSIAKKPLNITDVKAQNRYYAADDKSVDIISATLSGLEVDAEGTDDVKFADGQKGTLISDAVGAYTTVTLTAPVLDGTDAIWYTVEDAECATDVSILAIPADNFEIRMVINENYTDADVQATDLGKVPTLDTVAEIDAQLRLMVADKGAVSGNAQLYDVMLEYKDANGKWMLAEQKHFPANGFEITLPVVTGTTPATHVYTVAHMFTRDMNGHKAGEVEYPMPTAYQDANGRWMLKFVVNGMSPIMVAATPIPSADLLPQTGDSSNVVFYVMMLAISVIGLAMAKKRRTE